MKQKFTIQIRGNVLVEDQIALEQQMRETLKKFPNFSMTFSSVEVWTDFSGKPRVFNDDGSDYKEEAPVAEKTEESK